MHRGSFVFNSDMAFCSVFISSLIVLPLSGYSLNTSAYVFVVQSLVLCGTHYGSAGGSQKKVSVADEFELV